MTSDLVTFEPGEKVLLMNDYDEEFYEGTADDDGIVRNDQGHAFSAGVYNIVGKVNEA